MNGPARNGSKSPCQLWYRKKASPVAQELLQENKIRSRRRTIEPSVAPGLVSRAKCG
jgi:hypothetical protein